MLKITLKDTLSCDIVDLPGEIWEDIPGYEDRYQISQYSRVKSIIYEFPVIIKKSLSAGRHKVNLYDKRKRMKSLEVSRLCLSVFGRCPEENEVIRHKDRNVLFDAASNLEWVSRKDSAKLAYREGRYPEGHGKGFKNPNAKLSPETVLSIRKQFDEGIDKKVLSEKFNLERYYVDRIVKGRIWKTV